VKTRRRYNRRDVLELVRRAGLHPLRATYWNTALFPVIVAVRRWRRQRRDGVESDLRPIASCWNEALYALTRAEALWLRHASLAFGTSVFCVARKS